MGSRNHLQIMLENILGSRNVYYQPPPSIEMQYDCIVYKRTNIQPTYADNIPYSKRNRYSVTVITKSPDSEIVDKMAALPMCRFERAFTATNLYHNVFNLYY